MSSLEQQLKRLKTAQTEEFRQVKYRVSFLYDKKEAAAIDCDTHLRVANKRFRKLSKLSPDLLQFVDFFNEQSKDIDRSSFSKDENDELSISMRKLINNLVVPFFMLNDCHETLEYLIYKYQIHNYETNDLLSAMLPYHETRLFARALQVFSNLDTSLWGWLESYKTKGVPVPKEKMISVLASKSALVALLGDKLIEMNRDSNKVNIFTSFYTTTMMCVLDRAQSEQFYVTFMPHILRAIKKSNNTSLFMACLVLVGYLAYTQDLDNKYLDKLETRLRKTHAKLREKESQDNSLIDEYHEKVLKLLSDNKEQ